MRFLIGLIERLIVLPVGVMILTGTIGYALAMAAGAFVAGYAAGLLMGG